MAPNTWEMVPSFLAQGPVVVDEDYTPFTVTWGLQTKNTIVSDSRAAAEWSKSTITPRDWNHIVESFDDLQIEFLGAQAVALVSLIFFTYPFYHFSCCTYI